MFPEQPSPRWRKSSRSSQGANTCVEVAITGASILVRDSKDPDGARLRFARDEWLAFLAGVRDGEFDPDV